MCPMCAQKTYDTAKALPDGVKVCPRCWKRAQGRKTMTFEEYRRLCMCNSSKVPKVVEMGGTAREWTGIGVIEIGPATGKEVLITP